MKPLAPSDTPRPKASFLRRALAFLLDAVVLTLLGFALLALVSLLLGPATRIALDGTAEPAVEVIGWRALLNALLLAALSAGFFVFSWTRSMHTPGQALMGIHVEDANGPAPMPAGRAALRWALLGAPLGIAATAVVNAPLVFLGVSVVSVVWFAILLLTTLFSRSGRGVHDRFSGSIAVRARRD